MRRTMLVAVLTAALMVFTAGPAFAGHCVNLSKKADAGNLTTVLIDPDTEDASVVGGQIKGGYADVYLDVNRNGQLDSGVDLLLDEDVQIGKNHSPQNVEVWVNPGAENKAENPNATDDNGMIVHG